jgi:serine/threonine protein kinase/tetratricopeptide (TPR) repeat protein
MRASLKKIEAIFHDAVALPASDRGAFVDRACAGDPDLLREVESLLQHNDEQTAAFEGAVQPVASDLLTTALLEPHFAPGAMLGPYRLDRKLGEGGMGSVYLATDTRLTRKVAVKFINCALARTAAARARFLREARSGAALCHANIATLHDLGETAKTPWLVMEYVSGASLRSRLTGPLGESTWVRYATEIAAALEHAHTRRIIHRDIKPENIIITDDDHVKVIDFGLARAVHEQPAASGTITEPNAFMGTLAYAAPELFAGGSASARSDVYSLGVVLYEMACGEQPFARLTGHALISAILAGSYPACKMRNPRIPPRVAALIDQCMSREPAARYKDAAVVAAALHHLGNTDGFQQADTTPPPTLAVIDFRNIGGGSDVDWLGTGIAETLSVDLAKLRSVRVASRGRVVQSLRRLGSPQNDADTAIELGRDLGARWIVTGGYQQIGDRFRVTAALIDAGTGDALATEKIDGRWADLFDVQDRVVAALLKSLTIVFDTTDQQKILPAETRDMVAYEHYVRARQQMYEMGGKSLSAAIHHFEQAVRLDPDYALAYSGLGTAHALQFIDTSNPEDIIRASGYLERAIELDAELGEPYPWLVHIRIRKNNPAGAFAAGRKGLELQPDLAESHYFYSGGHYMLPEFEPGSLRTTPAHLAEAIRLQPRFHAAWLVLGATSAFLGKHADAIRILTEAVRMEAEPDLMYRFVGARTLLAIARTRAGLWDAARAQYLDALEALRDTDHIYTTCFQILSACGLGDIELRCRNESAALTHYRHARRIVRESPRAVGGARLLIRINAGLSAAYAATGEMTRAIELATEASTRLESLAGQTATATFECSLPQLWLTLAATEVRLGNFDAAGACLARARELGWLDLPWLNIDPELRPLHGHPAFLSFVEKLGSAPDSEIPLPRFGAPRHARPQFASGTA